MKTTLTKEIESRFIDFLYDKKYELAVQECSMGKGGRYGIVDVLSYHGKLEHNGRGKPITRSATWRCYEIKVSKQDFYSKHKLTFVGDYNYFVIPLELFETVKKDIPPEVGCYVYDGFSFKIAKKAKKQKGKLSESQIMHDFLVSATRDARRWVRNKEKLTKLRF